MHRRNILATALAATGALFAAGGKSARAEGHAGAKAVYHLSDLDKAGFVLGNIDHHLEGAGRDDSSAKRQRLSAHPAKVGHKSCQSSFCFSISSIFQARAHRLILFSWAIA